MVLYLTVNSLAYCFLNLLDAKPIMPNAKMARVEGSVIEVVWLPSLTPQGKILEITNNFQDQKINDSWVWIKSYSANSATTSTIIVNRMNPRVSGVAPTVCSLRWIGRVIWKLPVSNCYLFLIDEGYTYYAIEVKSLW